MPSFRSAALGCNDLELEKVRTKFMNDFDCCFFECCPCEVLPMSPKCAVELGQQDTLQT